MECKRNAKTGSATLMCHPSVPNLMLQAVIHAKQLPTASDIVMLVHHDRLLCCSKLQRFGYDDDQMGTSHRRDTELSFETAN